MVFLEVYVAHLSFWVFGEIYLEFSLLKTFDAKILQFRYNVYDLKWLFISKIHKVNFTTFLCKETENNKKMSSTFFQRKRERNKRRHIDNGEND